MQKFYSTTSLHVFSKTPSSYRGDRACNFKYLRDRILHHICHWRLFQQKKKLSSFYKIRTSLHFFFHLFKNISTILFKISTSKHPLPHGKVSLPRAQYFFGDTKLGVLHFGKFIHLAAVVASFRKVQTRMLRRKLYKFKPAIVVRISFFFNF